MSIILVEGVEYKTYGFEYGHEGKRWGLDIVATSEEDAKARLKALAFAQCKGEVVARIYVPTPTLWLSRLRRIATRLNIG